MCGIVGYAGKAQAVPMLLEGLSKLEYRGYDSAGICVYGGDGLQIVKTKGRLQTLADKLKDNTISGTAGIGHTRWATHGAPSDINSHPHLSDNGKIALVHNGIIENEGSLRKWLLDKGVGFRSETDTEVIVNLVEYYYAQERDFLQAVRRTLTQLEGSFALGIMCADCPGTLIAAKKDSPLIFGVGDGENYVASDVPAILKYTKTVVYMDDGELAVFTADSVQFYNAIGERIEKKRERITWQISDAQRDGYVHYMLKEIMEQPKALRSTILPRISRGEVRLEGVDLTAERLERIRKIYFVACGSAYYVSVIAKYTVEKACRIPTEAVMASEFRYAEPVIGENDLVVVISQSGETADSLAALREAKRRKAHTLAIVNVVGSAISKVADQVIYTWAGPEIAVATTKAFTSQLAVVWLLAACMAWERKTVTDEAYGELVKGLEQLPDAVKKTLSEENLQKCQYYASRYCGDHSAFYIGRNMDSAVCLEGSLKLKEVAYLHSEAYPAGELKHGPIAMIQKGTLVVALMTVETLADKMVANIREVTARGAEVLCIVREDLADRLAGITENIIAVPAVYPILQPSLSVIPMQLLAYYVAVNRGCDVDKPRNLAKSVTVE